MSRHILHGINGERWDLTFGEEVIIGEPGPVGLLGFPEVEIFSRQLAYAQGQSRTGSRAKARTGTLPVIVNPGRPLQELRSIETRWWDSWSVDAPCTYEVHTEGRGSRYLEIFLQDDGGGAFKRDPDSMGFYASALNVVADDPFWRGDKLFHDFNPNRPPVDFYGRDRGQRGGPRFYRSPSIVRDVQQLFNPGDVPSPLVWTLTGPFDSFELTAAGETVALDRFVPEGQTVTVDSRNYSVILDTGGSSVDLTAQASWGFASLPAGSAVPVGVLVFGTGRVKAEWTPKFRRAA